MSDGPATVDVRVLGPLEVRRSGELIMIVGAKPRAILTILGLSPRQVVPASVLQDIIWGSDRAPRTAQKALLTHIAALRRALGDGIVVTTGTGWTLAIDHTDTDEFEAAVRAGREAMRAAAMPAAVGHLERALSTWRGRPELPATPRSEAELTRWQESYEAIVDDRAEALLGCGKAAELIGELEAAVVATPLRERRWAQLCLALYRAGRQGDALHAYRRAREVLSDELGVEPGPELRQLESAILQQDASLQAPAPNTTARASPANLPTPMNLPTPASLPTPPTAFIGRTTELRRLRELVAGHRLVTITGPGGVGKTRLAIAAAADVAPAFPAGLWFVDLAAARADVVIETVAVTTGVIGQSDQSSEDSLYAHFGTDRVLLILDNCEHLADSVSAFAERLLARCPGVVVVATSRERLHTPGEQVFTLAPLSTAASNGSYDSDAARLFLVRARAVEPDFEADGESVAAVCARCDGLPLAIELAAARSGSLGIDGLLAGLDDHVRVLVGARVATERHRSLRAVLDWSHHLLDAEEQALFRHVSEFNGTFDLAAATALTDGLPRAVVVDLIGRLTDKNLLIHERAPTGSRWRMLNVVRSYAAERLAASGEKGAVRSRHLRWATRTVVALEQRLDAGSNWRPEFDLIAADLRAALAIVDDGEHRLTLALALARLHARSGAFTFAQTAYERAMALARLSGDADQLARAALGASTPGMLFGVTQVGRVALLEEALAARADEPSDATVRLLARLATELYWSTDRKRSHDLAARATAMADQLGSVGAGAHALYAEQYVTRSPGMWRHRLSLTERVIDLAVTSGETQLELAGRAAHAAGLLEAGDLDGMDAEVTALTEAADRRDHPEFQWYAAVYRLVRSLVIGRFHEADGLAAAAAHAARYAPEFAVGLFFAEAITDLRELDEASAGQRSRRLAEMVERFPRVFVWRCLALLDRAGRGPAAGLGKQAAALTDELLRQPQRDAHWLLGCCLLAEAVSSLGDVDLAVSLENALRPYADGFAVAGRVAAFRGSISHALGLLAMAAGNSGQAVADLEEAVRRHDGIGAPPFRDRSHAALERARRTAH